MKICRKNYNGYKQVSDDYNLVDVNRYDNKELLEDSLVITKAMSIEKCNTKEQLKESLLEIIDNIEGDEYLNKIERIVKFILKKSLSEEETSNMLERINNKKKGLYDMLTVLERIEMNERKKEKIEIAKEMLKEKIDINKISKCTKLSKSKLEKMQKEFEGEAQRLG